MNSNVVYGSAMSCHNSGISGTTTPSSDYHHHQGYHFGADLSSYYQPAQPPPPPTSDLAALNGSTQHSALSSSTPPNSHYSSSTFHMPGSIHPFGESVPPSIISEPNGLSYTNLDLSSQNSYGSNPVPPSHYQRLSQFNSSVPVQGQSGALAPPSHPTTQCSQLSSTSMHSNAYTQSFREYGSTGQDQTSASTPTPINNNNSNQQNSTTNSHHEMISPHSDCSLGRSSSSGSSGSHYPNYFESNLLSRSRNGTPVHHSMHLQNGISSPYVDPSSHYNEMACNQLNGNTYHHHHLNHLSNHLQSSHHHTTNPRNTTNSNSNLLTTAPVPQYKWMQVKRNIPKPGKEVFFPTD